MNNNTDYIIVNYVLGECPPLEGNINDVCNKIVDASHYKTVDDIISKQVRDKYKDVINDLLSISTVIAYDIDIGHIFKSLTLDILYECGYEFIIRFEDDDVTFMILNHKTKETIYQGMDNVKLIVDNVRQFLNKVKDGN